MEWRDVVHELVTFVGWFLTYGAAAFGAIVLRDETDAKASRRAATLGAIGVLVALASQLLGGTSGAVLAWRVVCLAAALVGFVLARSGRRAGFAIALAASVGIALRNVVTGDPRRLLHPVHVLAGGLWIGTLFALFVAALRAPRAEPAAIARMVRRFSVLARAAVALLALTGVGSAVRDMTRVADLWTTPWGWTLCAKLVLVIGVLATGFHNWRIATPRLPDAAGTDAFARSARTELLLAAAVLLVTGVLVSLPAPRA